jgi:hypothetical protein
VALAEAEAPGAEAREALQLRIGHVPEDESDVEPRVADAGTPRVVGFAHTRAAPAPPGN